MLMLSFEYCKNSTNQHTFTFIPLPSLTIKPNNSALESIKLITAHITQPFYAFFITAGRRLLFPWMNMDKTLKLLNGRRIRIYHAFKENGKLKIQFGWIALQIMNQKDTQLLKEILLNNISDLWQGAGRQFIVKVGGKLFHQRFIKFAIETI